MVNKKLRKAVMFLAAVAAAVGLFGAGLAFGSGSKEPGTQGDPIVTLSYLESRLASIDGSGSSKNGSGSGSGFEKVFLSKGEKLQIADGGIAVVSSGSGKVFGSNGMLNLSSGELFADGNSAVLYSMFLSCGSDSGINASGNMTVYVCGNYSKY